MSQADVTTVIVERFRYVSDWFEIDKVGIDLSKPSYFEFDYRLGSWYLEQYVQQEDRSEPWKPVFWPKGYAFMLQDPAAALVVLGDRVRSLHSSNSYGRAFLKELHEILAQAKAGAQ